MAYNLKYQSDSYSRNGHTFQLKIYIKDTTVASVKKIGNLRDVHLELQGSSEAVESPIIKTNLSWTVADEWDHADANGYKYGHWEEFWTPDATKYKVELLRDGAVEWSGYVTPDSYADDLTYNSYLTIVARDNIGHLQDFIFDASAVTMVRNTLTSVKNLMQAAWSVVECPLTLTPYTKTKWLTASGGGNGYEDFLFDTAELAGMNWYKAVETVLADMGLCLRFGGSNKMHLAPLRYMAYYGGSSLPTAKTAQLLTGASRRLQPAYKQIEETGSYELCDDDTPCFDASEWNSSGVLTKNEWSQSSAWASRPMTDAGMATLELPGDKERVLMLKTGLNCAVVHSHLIGVSTKIKVSFTTGRRGRWQNNNWALVTNVGIRVNFRLRWGSSLYWNDEEKSWKTASSSAWTFSGGMHDYGDASLSFDVNTPSTAGTLYLEWYIESADNTVYVNISDLSISIDGTSIPSGWKITTIYDDKQNTTLHRDGTFGICPSWCKSAGTIRNGLYITTAYQGNECLYNTYFGGESANVYPLPVMCALQIIALHHQSNSVFSGELRSEDDDYFTFDSLWSLYGKTCILTSGIFNLMTGRVEGAELREFVDYAVIWEI